MLVPNAPGCPIVQFTNPVFAHTLLKSFNPIKSHPRADPSYATEVFTKNFIGLFYGISIVLITSFSTFVNIQTGR